MRTDRLPPGAKITGGFTNTPRGRVHWSASPDGIADFGFNAFVLLKRILTKLKYQACTW